MKCKTFSLFGLGVLIIVMSLWSIYMTMTMSFSKLTIDFEFLKVHWYDNANIYVCLLIGVAICHYAVTESPKTYQLIMAFLILVIGYQLIALMLDPSKEKVENDIKIGGEKLKAMMPNYDWSGKDQNSTKTKPTEVWNYLQSLVQCCGLESAQDWNDYRPEGVASDSYPSSCCLFKTNNYCEKTFLNSEGCIVRFKDINAKSSTVRMVFIAFYLLIVGIMAYLSYKKKGSS